MAASSPAARRAPRGARRSVRSALAALVALPAACLVLLGVLAVTTTAGGGLTGNLSPNGHRDLVKPALLVGAGAVIVIAAAIMMGSFTSRLSRDLRDLAAAARHLADEQSQPAGRLSGGMHAARPDGALRPRTKVAEIAQAAAAIASLQHAASTAVASEAALRDGLRQVFVSLARRNQSLLRRQLGLIDALEQKASDPAALADLFTLDHLTTRMRRHAESLAILSGAAPGRSWREPVAVIDVIRGATAEVEDYTRVTVLTAAQDAVTGPAVADMIHLLAELIENATLSSPASTQVEVRAGLVGNGFAVEIDDRGLGVEPEHLIELNQQLASPPDFDLADPGRLGLFVAAKLAARHGVRVCLRTSPYGGITAIVLMPGSIIVPAREPDAGGQPGAGGQTRGGGQTDASSPPVIGRAAGLDLSGLAGPGLNSVTGRGGVNGWGGVNGRGGVNGGGAGGHPGAGTRNGLPRRTRQARLAQRLGDSPAAPARPPGADAGPPSAQPPTPQQARDLAASLQRGWRRGRQVQPPAQGGPDPQPADQQDPATPQTEEES